MHVALCKAADTVVYILLAGCQDTSLRLAGSMQEANSLRNHSIALRCQGMQVLDGRVGVLEAEASSLSAAELYKKVLPFSGMGPFTAANVLQLLGVFAHARPLPALSLDRCTSWHPGQGTGNRITPVPCSLPNALSAQVIQQVITQRAGCVSTSGKSCKAFDEVLMFFVVYLNEFKGS